MASGFRRLFPQHSTVQSLNAAHQRKTLQEMLQAAQQAEKIFSLSLALPAKPSDYLRNFQLQPPEVSATKPLQAHTQVKPRLHSTATLAVEVTPRTELPPLEEGKVSGSTAALAVAGLIRGLSFAMASTW